jgi:hypothetical protein
MREGAGRRRGQAADGSNGRRGGLWAVGVNCHPNTRIHALDLPIRHCHPLHDTGLHIRDPCCDLADTEEVTGSIPVAPTKCTLTSVNAGQSAASRGTGAAARWSVAQRAPPPRPGEQDLHQPPRRSGERLPRHPWRQDPPPARVLLIHQGNTSRVPVRRPGRPPHRAISRLGPASEPPRAAPPWAPPFASRRRPDPASTPYGSLRWPHSNRSTPRCRRTRSGWNPIATSPGGRYTTGVTSAHQLSPAVARRQRRRG